MYKFIFKNDEGLKTPCMMPSEWEEFTVDMLARLETIPFKEEGKEPDWLKLVHILTGINIKDLYNSKKDQTGLIQKAMSFIVKTPPPWKDLPMSNVFTLDGIEYPIPKDLEFETAGQKMLVTQALDKNKPEAVIAYCIAIYMIGVIDGEWTEESEDKAEELEKVILQMPAVDMFPIALFFFKRLNEFTKYGIKGYQLSQQQKIAQLLR